MSQSYLQSAIKQFAYYKQLGDQTFSQLSDEALFVQPNAESNSIAIIVQHLYGNMRSRWIDFLTSDGEKEWRDRDAEFEPMVRTRAAMLQQWEEGWKVLFTTLESLTDADLEKTIYIRNQGHTVVEAINRQLAHYPYHIGQIVYIGKLYASQWASLSIPRGNSAVYNAEKFKQPQHTAHFTDEYLQTGINKAQIVQAIQQSHQALWQTCEQLSAAQQQQQESGRWSALQHVHHIQKGLGAFVRYLQLDKQTITTTFGLADHASVSVEALLEQYHLKLGEGIQSTSRFNPDETTTLVLSEMKEQGASYLLALEQALHNWSESELDTYACPHPALGNLTVRELLYFTSFHATHHENGIKRLFA